MLLQELSLWCEFCSKTDSQLTCKNYPSSSYLIHKIKLLISILSYMSPVLILTVYFSKIHLNNILLFTLMSLKWIFPSYLMTKMSYELLISRIHAIYVSKLTLLHLIILKYLVMNTGYEATPFNYYFTWSSRLTNCSLSTTVPSCYRISAYGIAPWNSNRGSRTLGKRPVWISVVESLTLTDFSSLCSVL